MAVNSTCKMNCQVLPGLFLVSPRWNHIVCAASGTGGTIVVDKNWIWAALPLLAVALVAGLSAAYWVDGRMWAYLIIQGLITLELIMVGLLINGRWVGVFIDNRNRISLSKLQAGAWTAVVVAAFITGGAYNIAAEVYQSSTVTALAIKVPGELLLAMGISATSLVAAPALLSMKAEQVPSKAAAATADAAGGATLDKVGKLANKKLPGDASWADIFTGDEVGNSHSPDLGKIQQVLFTLLLLGSYVAYVCAAFNGGTEIIASLPSVDQSFVWLMGLSHASYLAFKAAPHTASPEAEQGK